MSQTVSLYTVTDEPGAGVKKAGGLLIVRREYDRDILGTALKEAREYTWLFVHRSYYEGEYDNYTSVPREINEECILLRDGRLYGFVYEKPGCMSGKGRYTQRTVFCLTDADTERSLTLERDSRDHGDTMSETSTCLALHRRGAGDGM